MSGYRTKTEQQLIYDESKKRVRFELNLMLARAMNDALAEMTGEFNEAVVNGGLKTFSPSREDALRYLRAATALQLGSGDADAA